MPRLRTHFALAVVFVLAGILPSTAMPSIASEGERAVPGQQLWAARYGVQQDNDNGTAVGVSPDGTRVFVAGTSGRPDTVAYDAATGVRIWTSEFVPGDVDIYSPHLTVSPDGSTVFVTGNYLGYRTVAYDAASGVQRWTASWQGTDSDTPTGIAVSPNGDTVYVTGYTFNQGGYVTVAYAAATGAQLWVSRYHNVGGDYAYALGVSPDGSRVFVTGASYDASDHSDYATVAYNAATGRQLWVSRYNGLQSDSEDSAGALAVGADGTTVFVTGSSQGLSIDTDYATVAYDAGSGAQLWVERYAPPPGSAEDVARAIGVNPDGSAVYVTGDAQDYSGHNYGTVAYDPSTGAELWDDLYTIPPGDSRASALVVAPDGSMVFVTGESLKREMFDYDFATVAYAAATGEQLWVARAGKGGSDGAASVAVSPDGITTYVTGHVDVNGWNDYYTIAYQT